MDNQVQQHNTISPGQATRDALEAETARVQAAITAFNSHWLNHKHLVSAAGVVVMVFIFLGMLVPSFEIVMWMLAGIFIVALVGVMAWRQQLAGRLNSEMEAVRNAFKEYERGRRK